MDIRERWSDPARTAPGRSWPSALRNGRCGLAKAEGWPRPSLRFGSRHQRQRADVIGVTDGSAEDGILEFHLETIGPRDAADRPLSPAEHNRTFRKRSGSTGVAFHELARVANGGRAALLINPPPAGGHDMRAQRQAVPMRRDLGKGPKLTRHHFAAELLRQRPRISLRGAVGVVGAEPNPK